MLPPLESSMPEIMSLGSFDGAAGQYQPNARKEVCLSCGAGKFRRASGATDCEGCPAGQFQAAEGQSGCLLCVAGRFAVHSASGKAISMIRFL